MNSKERVIAALERRPVDKVPLGLYLVDHDTIANVIGRPTYVRNPPKAMVALWEGRYDEVIDSMRQDIVDFYTKLDCVDLLTFKETAIYPRGYIPEDPPKKVDDLTYRDSKGNVFKISVESNGITQVESSYTPPAIDEYTEEMYADRTEPQLPHKHCESRFELMDLLIETFGDERYIATHSAGTTCVSLLGGFEQGLMLMGLKPEVVKAHNRQSVFRQNYLDRYYIRPGADGVFMEQDFSGTNGPYISPDMFRELAFPFFKERIEHVKQFLPHVIFHACGNTLPVMEMLIEAGIDAYESIQTTSEMSLENLGKRFGDRLTIWGAIPLEVLIEGSPDDTRRAVRENMEIGKDIPGFILGPSHSVAYGTKYDNFMAMLDEFDRLR